jgi:hypothetical protein
MLTSCQFMADGAVRRPSGRLMPKAAQSKFESVCCESVPEPNSRVDLRSLRTSIRGRPPIVCGSGSWTGLSACAAEIAEKQIVTSASVTTNGALCFIREFLPMFSAKILGFFGYSYCRPVCCRTL